MEHSTELGNSIFQSEHGQSIVEELRAVISGGIALPSDNSYEAVRRVGMGHPVLSRQCGPLCRACVKKLQTVP